jgi:hypothetical protein
MGLLVGSFERLTGTWKLTDTVETLQLPWLISALYSLPVRYIVILTIMFRQC